MMSTKVYGAVASVLSDTPMDHSTRWDLIQAFSIMFTRDNPNFDHGRFDAAVLNKVAKAASA